jgi:hypothetical protein
MSEELDDERVFIGDGSSRADAPGCLAGKSRTSISRARWQKLMKARCPAEWKGQQSQPAVNGASWSNAIPRRSN